MALDVAMNLTALLNFESMQYRGAQTQSSATNIFVANALRVFIEDFYQRIAPAFIVIISCRRPSPMNFYRNIMQLLYVSVDNMIVQLVQHNHSAPQRIGGPRLHNLLLIDSMEALLDVEIHTYTSNSDTYEYYYIFLQQRDALIPMDMQAIFEYCWRYQLIHCNVQIQNSRGEVTMHTYFPYASTHCARIVPIEINQFLGQAWQHRSYFPSKLHNLHKCPLMVVVRNEMPFMWATPIANEFVTIGYVLQGLEGQLLHEIALRLNFSLRINVMSSHANAEQSMLFRLEQRAAQLAIGYIRKRASFQHNHTTAFPHYSNTIISCVLLTAHNLTSYQILSFPYKPLAWLCILTTFIGVSLCLLCLIRLDFARRFQPGDDLTLSVYAMALGLPSVTLPKYNSHKLLFTGWLYFSFLLRAIYSALLFHLQRRHTHQRIPGTLLGMLRADFMAVLNRITLHDISEVPYFDQVLTLRHNKLNIIDSANERDVVQELETHGARHMVGIISRDVLMHYAYMKHRAGMYHIAPEDVMQQQLAIYLQKHSFLAQELDELIMRIQAVGLMDYWSRSLRNEKYFASTFLFGDQLLQQQQLKGLYVISMCMYFFAFIVFLLELYTSKKTKK